MSNGVYLLEDALSTEECDYFSNKLITMWEQKKLHPFFDEPQILIIRDPDEEDRLFKQKCYEILCKQIKDVFDDGPYVYMDGDLSLWRPGLSGTRHVDNVDPKIKGYGARYSSIFYLNDDYEGGEIEFPNLNLTYKPVKGSMVWFPDDPVGDMRIGMDWDHLDHLHQVKKITGNYRCTLPIWLG